MGRSPRQARRRYQRSGPRRELLRQSAECARRALASLGLACLASFGCEADTPSRPDTLRVLAASSLAESFRDLEVEFERAHPELDVVTSFAGSQVLRLQLEQGARADVLASANEDHLRALREQGLVGASRIFAQNELVVIVPRENPAGIERFEDLPRASRLVLGSEAVPVGEYARRLLSRAAERFGDQFTRRVLSHVVSEESNVRLVRAKVELGEADAALVYRTDAAAAEALRVVPIPEPLGVLARYAIAVVARSAQPSGARAFLDFVLSAPGRRVLAARGFVVAEPR